MRHPILAIAAAPLLALCLLVPAAARADVVLPDQEACQSKSAGDSCDTNDDMGGGMAGTCTQTTCNKAEYMCDGSVNPEGGPCGETSMPCLVCEPTDGGTGTGTGTGSGTGSGSGSGSGSGTGTGTGSEPGSGSTSSTKKNGGCSIGPMDPIAEIGPWLLAGAVPLVLRRRRKS